jgi:hypothetical protein
MALLGLRMALLLCLLLALVLCGLCIALGLSIAAALPHGFGDVTSLIALALVVASVWATAWLIGLARRLHNWAGESLTRRAFAPRDQFLSRDPTQPSLPYRSPRSGRTTGAADGRDGEETRGSEVPARECPADADPHVRQPLRFQ